MDRRFRMTEPATGRVVMLDMNWIRWAAEVGGDPLRVAFAVDTARSLLDANGLEGWGIKVSHASVQGGAIRYKVRRVGDAKFWNGEPGTLILSGPLMSLWDDVHQVRIILHEVAHAMCPDDSHGPVWRAYCRKLGIKPERCWGANGEEQIPRKPRQPSQHVWLGECPGGHRHRRERKPSRTLACIACDPVPQERYVITWRKVTRER